MERTKLAIEVRSYLSVSFSILRCEYVATHLQGSLLQGDFKTL